MSTKVKTIYSRVWDIFIDYLSSIGKTYESLSYDEAIAIADNMKSNINSKFGTHTHIMICDHIKYTIDTIKPEMKLWYYCNTGDVDNVKIMLNSRGKTYPTLDVNWSDDKHCTPLYTACQKSHLDIIELLISHPSVDVTSKSGPSSPLIKACEDGNMDVVQLFLASPRIGPEHDITMFYTQNLDVISYLIATRDNLGVTKQDIVKLCKKFEYDDDIFNETLWFLRSYLARPHDIRQQLRTEFGLPTETDHMLTQIKN